MFISTVRFALAVQYTELHVLKLHVMVGGGAVDGEDDGEAEEEEEEEEEEREIKLLCRMARRTS